MTDTKDSTTDNTAKSKSEPAKSSSTKPPKKRDRVAEFKEEDLYKVKYDF